MSKAIIPKPPRFDLAPVEAAMQVLGKKIQGDFQSTVRTWNEKPNFKLTVKVTRNSFELSVTTDSKIYRYVDEGTRPHIIRARRARALRFAMGRRAKTTPGVIGSRGGGGGKIRYALYVKHPGTAARNFTDTIYRRRSDQTWNTFEKAMRQVAKNSGHGR